MAINVNTVYTTVLSILNKEQRGYMTPDEFNKVGTQVQLEIFEKYFEDLNQQLRVPLQVAQMDSEYADRIKTTEEKISIFETSNDLTYAAGSFSMSVANPAIHRIGTLQYEPVNGSIPVEIQRLIGRSLRQSVNLKYLKDKTIQVDCDVIQADGGTRTASITGGCVALFLAIKNHHDDQRAIEQYVAAISLGVKDDEILVDLDYQEDSTADADINIVMTHNLDLIEIQGTAEERPFSQEQLTEIVNKASSSIKDIINIQKQAVEG